MSKFRGVSLLAAGLALAAVAGSAGSAEAAGAPARLEDRVLEFARQALLAQAERDGLLEPQVELSLPAGKTRAAAPPCPGDWEIEALELRQLNRLRLRARCPALGGNAGASQEFLLRGQLQATVLVAAAAVPAGRALGAADVELQPRDISNLPDVLSDSQALEGLSPRSSLRAGQVLQKRLLQAALLVRRGERVRIIADNGGIQVEAPGEALDAGARDAQIRVRNSSSGRIITARVRAPGQVEPADLPGR
ncbi:MAG: flagellar basal body P-ring formation chaperone FlgA [Burkholderiaceae bacterium]